MARFVLKGRPHMVHRSPKHIALLVVAPPGAEQDDVFDGLRCRADVRLLYATTIEEVHEALREERISLVIASPELPTATVSALLERTAGLRVKLPTLVIRTRQAEEPSGWGQRGVGVLRCPLLPDALGRSVDVVLGRDPA